MLNVAHRTNRKCYAVTTCLQLKEIKGKKADWPVLNVTERWSVQSPSELSFCHLLSLVRLCLHQKLV